MRVRCPFCRHVFEPGRKPLCPGCGRTVLMPGFYGGASGRVPDAATLVGARHGGPASPRPLLLSRRVIILVGLVLLALAALPVLQRSRGPAELSEAYRHQLARENMAVLRLALRQFHRDCGRFPRTDEGLAALLVNPGLEGWRGPYIFELKPDPWQRAFIYACEGEVEFILRSAGPDGVPGTGVDIILRGAAP